MEFLIRMTLDPDAIPRDRREDLLEQERHYAMHLRDAGFVLGMWRIADEHSTVSVWRAADPAELHAHIDGLPLRRWIEVEATPLSEHYLFPASSSNI